MTSNRYATNSMHFIYENQNSYKIQDNTPKTIYTYHSPKTYTSANFLTFSNNQPQYQPPPIQQTKFQAPSTPSTETFKNMRPVAIKTKAQIKDIQIYKRFLILAVNKNWSQINVNENWNEFSAFLAKQNKQKQAVETFFQKIQKPNRKNKSKSSAARYKNIVDVAQPDPQKPKLNLHKMLSYNEKIEINFPIRKKANRSNSLNFIKKKQPNIQNKKTVQSNPLLKLAQEIQYKFHVGDRFLSMK